MASVEEEFSERSILLPVRISSKNRLLVINILDKSAGG